MCLVITCIQSGDLANCKNVSEWKHWFDRNMTWFNHCKINTPEGNVHLCIWTFNKTDCRVYSGFKLTNLTWNKNEHEKINLKERNYNFQIPVSYKTSYNLARYFLSIFHIAIAHNFILHLHSFTKPSIWWITCTSLNKSQKSEKFIKITPFDKYKQFILQKSKYYSNKSRRVWKLARA